MHRADLPDMKWISPSAIAEAMLELVQEKQYPGGTILEFPTPNNKKVREREQMAKIGQKGTIQEILAKERST